MCIRDRLGPAIVASRGRWGVVRAEWRLIVGVALTGVAGCQIAYFNAVTHLQVSVALLIEYLGIVPVSYTHLDVYKRQLQSHTAPINEWIMEQLIMVDALKRASACLLYTSRCV